jgi:hypothetical protein
MLALAAEQLLAQQSANRTPYIFLYFASKDGLTSYDFSTDSAVYGNRIKLIDRTREPFNDYLYIMLDNTDRAIPLMKGFHLYMSMGDYYSGSKYFNATYCKFWVKEQRVISARGKLYTLLYLEGTWSLFREQLILLGDAPNYWAFNMDENGESYLDSNLYNLSIYDLIDYILAVLTAGTGITFTISGPTAPADGLLYAYCPNNEMLAMPFEPVGIDASTLLQQLLSFTKCVARISYGQFTILYPQDTDAVDKTYYSYQYPQFYDFTSNDPVMIPNRIIVYHSQSSYDNSWPPEAIANPGEALDQDSIDSYMVVAKVYLCGYIQDSTDAQNRADAILRKTDLQLVKGVLSIPYDASLELYDFLQINDARSVT